MVAICEPNGQDQKDDDLLSSELEYFSDLNNDFNKNARTFCTFIEKLVKNLKNDQDLLNGKDVN
jgi:hypothetical protein